MKLSNLHIVPFVFAALVSYQSHAGDEIVATHGKAAVTAADLQADMVGRSPELLKRMREPGSPSGERMAADIMLSDALMQAGGIGNQTELKDSKIMRGEDQIMDGEAFNKAVTDGVTLDQLNLRAGDVVEVGIKKPSDWYTTLRTIAVIPALIISTYGIGKLFGIF